MTILENEVNTQTTQKTWAKQTIVRGTNSWSVQQVSTMLQKSSINVDRAIQRKANRWSVEKKSLLIHSIVVGFGVLPLHANKITTVENNKTTNTYYILDGKQRITTINGFINNEFALKFEEEMYSSFIDEAGEVRELNGKTFAELDQEVQNMILSFTISIVSYDNLTEEQEVEIMDRQNKGQPMTDFEQFRIKQHQLIASIQNLLHHGFISEINFTAKQRTNSEDEQTIINILSILFAESYGLKPDFQKWGYYEFSKQFGTVSEIHEKSVIKIFDYALRAISILDQEQKKKILKKTHISGIVYMALQAIKDEIASEYFGEWVRYFFIEENKRGAHTKYQEASKQTAGKTQNIMTRIEELTKSYNKWFKKSQSTEQE